jgi:hypothetical protein
MSKRNSREAKARRAAERAASVPAPDQQCEMFDECAKPWSEVVVSVRGWYKRLCRYHSADIQRILNIGCAPDRNEVAVVYGADHLPLQEAQRMILTWMEADGRLS